MNGKNSETLIKRYQELEATTCLWMAANEAKDQRIRELEAECTQLRQRVARLTRQVGRRQHAAKDQKIRHAR